MLAEADYSEKCASVIRNSTFCNHHGIPEEYLKFIAPNFGRNLSFNIDNFINPGLPVITVNAIEISTYSDISSIPSKTTRNMSDEFDYDLS